MVSITSDRLRQGQIRATALEKSVSEIEAELKKMADDPDIQRELAAIELEHRASHPENYLRYATRERIRSTSKYTAGWSPKCMKTTAIVKNGIIEPSDKRVLKEGAHLVIEDVGSPTYLTD